MLSQERSHATSQNPSRASGPDADASRPSVGRRRALLLVGLLAGATLVANLIARPDTSPSGLASSTADHWGATEGPVTLGVRLDRGRVLRGDDGMVRMELTLSGAEEALIDAQRVSTDLVIVLDRSGSMGGDKIEKAREAVVELVERLGADDRFALVIYDHVAEVAIPLGAATAENRTAWVRQVRRIEPRGNTALSDGLDAGLDLLSRRRRGAAARLVLLSDGLANQGDTSAEGLRRRAQRAADLAAPLSSVGVGADFDEQLMGALADAGAGNFYFLQDAVHLAEVFADELGAAREMVAEGLAVTLRPDRAVRVVDVAGYPLQRSAAGVTFRPGSLYAGQERRIWVTLQVDDRPEATARLADVSVAYSRDGEGRTMTLEETPRIARVDTREEWLESFDRDRWASAVIEDDYGRLQQLVAEDVKAGKREEAKRKIEAYRASTEALNRSLQSPEVTGNLAEVSALEEEVDDVFEGANQAVRQNMLSKQKKAAGWDQQRPGAKRKVEPKSATGGGGR